MHIHTSLIYTFNQQEQDHCHKAGSAHHTFCLEMSFFSLTFFPVFPFHGARSLSPFGARSGPLRQGLWGSGESPLPLMGFLQDRSGINMPGVPVTVTLPRLDKMDGTACYGRPCCSLRRQEDISHFVEAHSHSLTHSAGRLVARDTQILQPSATL